MSKRKRRLRSSEGKSTRKRSITPYDYSLELKAEMQAKLKDHINELKQRQQNRLKEFDRLEEEYFKSLNEKMIKLK